MNKKLVATGVVCASIVAGCGGATKSDPPKPKHNYDHLLWSNFDKSIKVCNSYFDLVNAGESDSQIFSSMRDIDPSNTHAWFLALVRWCYRNDT